MAQGEVFDDLGFDVAETVFALALKKLADRTTDALLDHVIGVHKRHTEATRQMATDGGFA